MSSTILEQARLLHEDNDLHRQGAVQVLLVDHKLGKEVIAQQAKVRAHLDAVVQNTRKAIKLYEDADGLRKQELDDMSGDQVFQAFYDRLMGIREYHKKFPNAVRPSEAAVATVSVENPFSPEEHSGKFLDLHGLYARYVNLLQFKRAHQQIDYLTYLAKFDKFDAVPRWKKLGAKCHEYEAYLNDLHKYLAEFYAHTQPLVDLSKLHAVMDEDFEERWAQQLPTHWHAPEAPPPTAQQLRERAQKERADKQARAQAAAAKADADRKNGGAAKPTASPTDDADDAMADDAPAPAAAAAAAAAAPAAAAAAMMDGAPAAAAAAAGAGAAAPPAPAVDEKSPLFCKACKHMFAKQSVFDAHLNGKKHKKAAEKLAADQAAATAASQEAAAAAILAQQKKLLLQKQFAAVEDKIGAFADLLSAQLTDTQKFVEKKQTSLPDEIRRDMLAEQEREQAAAEAAALAAEGKAPAAAAAADDSDSDDEKAPYNPLNLPLDYNGKPIPYWLYKLHGLNIEYKCELCGSYSYWGPRAFERHFKEWRHAYGLKCLGIPNLKEFMNVTRIDDAKQLWDKLSKENQTREFRPDEDEEFEDHDGNVYNKKTYEDLRRQGLI